MITPSDGGTYKLILTKQNQKILQLNNFHYQILGGRSGYKLQLITKRKHKTDCILSAGHFQTYEVIEERNLSEYIHLELEAGADLWQGYVLPTGLPTSRNITARIIPISENVARSRLDSRNKIVTHINQLSKQGGSNYEKTLSIKYR